MTALISSKSVCYVCVTAVILFTIHSCKSVGLSDKTAQAVSAACVAAGQSMRVRLVAGDIKAECVPQ